MKKLIFLLSFITAFNFTASAETINLEQMRLLALANSRSLAKYDLSLKSSLLEEKTRLFALLPSVSANYNAGISYLDKNWAFVNPLENYSAGARLSLTQKIFEGGRNLIHKSLSSISTDSVRNEALAEYFNVLDSADKAYYSALEAAKNLKNAELSLNTAVLSLSIAEIRKNSGMLNQGEYLKALAEKESRENSRNQARRNLTLANNKIKLLTGLSEVPELEPISFDTYNTALEYLSGISDTEADVLFEKLYELIAKTNPALARAAYNRLKAEKNLALSKREAIPSINATIFTADLSYSPKDGFISKSGGGIYLSGNIPLDFWVLNNKIEKSKIAVNSASIEYINAEKSLETELYNTLINIFTQAGAVLSSRRTVEYSEKHLEFVTERYKLSQSSVSDLSDALALASSAGIQLVRSEYGFLQSLSSLRSLAVIEDEEKLMHILTGGIR